VEKVFGYPTESDKAGIVHARIGSVAAAQKREVIVRLHHAPASGNRMPLGRMVVSFTDARTGLDDHLVLLPAVEVTSDAAAARASERTEVTVRVAELEAAARLKVATDAVDRGNYEEAKDLIEGTLGDLRQQAAETPSEELERQIKEMEEAYDEVDQAKSSAAARKRYKKKHKSRVYLKGKK
jgi:Ca-activated chloride channel family protein